MKVKVKPFKNAQGKLINEIEISEIPKADKKTEYSKLTVFIDPDGWWRDKFGDGDERGKHLLGIKDENGNRYWPSSEDMHKLFLGWIIATAKNSVPSNQPSTMKNGVRFFEKDFSPVKSLMENVLREIKKTYGQEFLDQFFDKIEEATTE